MGNIRPRAIHFSTILLMFMASFGYSVLAEESTEPEPSRVLLLNSYHLGYPWSDKITTGVRETLGAKSPSIEVLVEYMDTKRHLPSKMFPILAKLYLQKYANSDLSAIICSDNNALDFLLQYRSSLFPDIPIIFCGINGFNEAMLQGNRGITGIVEATSFRRTIALSLKLHPQTKTIYSVAGAVTTSEIHIKELAVIAREFKGIVDFKGLHGLSANQLASALQNLPKDSLVLYLGFLRDKEGSTFSVEEAISLVQKNSARPVYSMYYQNLSHCLGGVMISGREQGIRAAAMTVEVIRQKSVEAIPIIQESPNVTMLNNDELLRFNVDRESLPPDCRWKLKNVARGS